MTPYTKTSKPFLLTKYCLKLDMIGTKGGNSQGCRGYNSYSPVTPGMTWKESLSFSVSQFPICKMGLRYLPHRGVVRLFKIMFVKCFEILG